MSRPSETRDSQGRLKGVDSIRAICALVVVAGHYELFSDAVLHSSNHVLRTVARISAFSWNGPAAVIVFFLISGFCIHLPFRGDRPLQPMPFLSRRLLRVGLPGVAFYLLSLYLLHDLTGFHVVVWSVVCEGIYYLVYPLIRPLAGRTGWPLLILSTYVLGVGLALGHLHELVLQENAYTGLGAYLTWVVGLPCWLLGCWLAETERSFRVLPRTQMAPLRVGMFAASLVLRIVKFHVHSPLASNVFTLNLFAVLAFFWLGFEIAYYKCNEPPKVLEWMGRWSYSIYLMHALTPAVLASVGLDALISLHSQIHVAILFFALLLSYLFHRVVELPSHRLAVLVSRKV